MCFRSPYNTFFIIRSLYNERGKCTVYCHVTTNTACDTGRHWENTIETQNQRWRRGNQVGSAYLFSSYFCLIYFISVGHEDVVRLKYAFVGAGGPRKYDGTLSVTWFVVSVPKNFRFTQTGVMQQMSFAPSLLNVAIVRSTLHNPWYSIRWINFKGKRKSICN